MPKFYASLMIKQGGGYVTIEANSRRHAREKMFASKYGEQWGFMYDESEKADSLDAYDQTEVDTIA